MSPIDYRNFLGKEEYQVLPFFGATSVDAPGRRLRLSALPNAIGWYRFVIKGRSATPHERSEPPALSELPVVRGHVLGPRLVRDGAIAELLELMPEEQPAPFTPGRARRWYSGELIFEQFDFEGDAEALARRALEEDRSLLEVKGAAASLRAAFGYAVIEAASRRLAIPVSPTEVKAHIADIANRGRPAAEETLHRLAAERAQAQREMNELHRRHQEALAAEAVRDERERRIEAARQTGHRVEVEAPVRAEIALEGTGARLRSARLLGGGNLEVVFTFMNERFISVVNAVTLQVIDSGICLGHPPRDEWLTLDSLPSVIKEAIDTDALVILRHG